MARRKIVLVIVEGPSDADSLELYFSKFFDSNTVHMKIMYGDITSKRGINQSNIKARLGNEIKIYAENNHFKATDVQQIIHLVDMDVNDTLRMYKNDDIRMYNFNCITDTIVEVITTCNTYTLLTVHLL